MFPQTTIAKNEAQAAMLVPTREPQSIQKWYCLEGSTGTRLLGVDPTQGLTASEVLIRREQYGPNNIGNLGTRRVTETIVLLCLSIVMGFLLTAAILNRATGDSVEGFSLIVVVITGAIVSYAYVIRSLRALDAIRSAAKSTVSVMRESHETKVKGEELVPGDIILVRAEDLVPADARLIEASQLEAREWAITGERTPAEKGILEVAPGTPLEMRKSMVYAGTTISSGSGLAVVVATGLQTELGRRAAGND